MKQPFLRYFNNNVKQLKFIERGTSPLMKTIDLFLKFLNIFRKLFNKPLYGDGEFLTKYTTTIGNRIYSNKKWTFYDEPSKLVVHELTHVVQWGFCYAVNYLTSKKMRLCYELEALQSEALCFTFSREDVVRRADRLVGYGIDRNEAIKEINKVLSDVSSARIDPEAKLIHETYVKWLSL